MYVVVCVHTYLCVCVDECVLALKIKQMKYL